MSDVKVTLPEPLLKASDVARVLSVDRRTVYRWADEGLLPAVRLAGTLRFTRRALEALIEEGSGR